MTFPNGIVYSGHFLNGLYDGAGTLTESGMLFDFRRFFFFFFLG